MLGRAAQEVDDPVVLIAHFAADALDEQIARRAEIRGSDHEMAEPAWRARSAEHTGSTLVDPHDRTGGIRRDELYGRGTRRSFGFGDPYGDLHPRCCVDHCDRPRLARGRRALRFES